MSQHTYTGRMLIGALSWKPAKLDSQGEVSTPPKLVVDIESTGELAPFVDFAAGANGEKLRVRIHPTVAELERFEGVAQLKGAKWTQGSGQSIKCSLEFEQEKAEETMAFVGMRLGMDAGSEFEAAVTLTLVNPPPPELFDEQEEPAE